MSFFLLLEIETSSESYTVMEEKMKIAAARGGAATEGGVGVAFAGEISNQTVSGKDDTIIIKRSWRSNKSSSFSKPSWLLSAVADLDERMKMLAPNNNYDGSSNNTMVKEDEDEDGDGDGDEDEEEDDEDKGKKGGDSFAERAEAYYEERPQLLSLLRDLYNCYLTLADRYCQTLAKHHLHLRQHQYPRQRSSPIKIKPDLAHYEESDNFSDCHKEVEGEENDNSDAESSLSYQQPSTLLVQNPNGGAGDGSNMIVVELVMKMVEYDIVANEMEEERRLWKEWWRKIELQKSLVEVLESERMILLNENARLRYKVMAVVEENKTLAAETVFVKRKAAEMARCLFKMREDHRVSLLTCKIQDLQAQIYGLERTRNNKEELIANSSSSSSSNSNGSHGSDHDATTDGGGRRRRRRSVKKVSKWWWSRVKSFDLLIPARMCTDAT